MTRTGTAVKMLMVCGSRTWTNLDVIRAQIKYFAPSVVIHGGQHGADLIAANVARDLGCVVGGFPPNPNVPSPARFHARNDAMLRCRPDMVLAFRMRGESRGTDSVVEKAKALGLVVCVTHMEPQP